MRGGGGQGEAFGLSGSPQVADARCVACAQRSDGGTRELIASRYRPLREQYVLSPKRKRPATRDPRRPLNMIADPVLRWIVTALFVISAAECVYALAAGRRSLTHTVGHLLHLVMAIAMAVMEWPRGAALPTTGPMLFFLAATVWFAAITLVESGHRTVNAYHASMMLAMAWMYAVMSGSLLPSPSAGLDGVGGHGMSSMASMAGM